MWTVKKPIRREHGQKVDRPRGLAAAEKVQKPGRGGVEAGGHGEPGQDHQRQGQEQDRGIGELLQHVVIRRVVEAEPRMVGKVAGQGAKVGETREKLAQVAVQRRGQQPERKGQDQHPGEEEMDHPASREALVDGIVRAAGKARGSPPETPRKPVVSNSAPRTCVTPRARPRPRARRWSGSRCRKSKPDSMPICRLGKALKICRPVSIRKKRLMAQTQWVTLVIRRWR